MDKKRHTHYSCLCLHKQSTHAYINWERERERERERDSARRWLRAPKEVNGSHCACFSLLILLLQSSQKMVCFLFFFFFSAHKCSWFLLPIFSAISFNVLFVDITLLFCGYALWVLDHLVISEIWYMFAMLLLTSTSSL